MPHAEKLSQKTKINRLLSQGSWLTLPEICLRLDRPHLTTSISARVREIRRELEGTHYELKSRLRGKSKTLWEHVILPRESGSLPLFGDVHAA